ncbi:hypothetical protein MTR_7g097130 [Medicago truncatula]|uniref:Uncharacterized protein n=1 Tax=Medicago truncatula TaxID=3880 RepID=A0A072U3L0_MEDTR|nr:hypothetical protein MTR_7g097130 [Medicago truncatula]
MDYDLNNPLYSKGALLLWPFLISKGHCIYYLKRFNDLKRDEEEKDSSTQFKWGKRRKGGKPELAKITGG